jgi:hypothetical protein
MDTWNVMQQLYDSEINAGLAADWDGGITAWIAGGREPLSERTFLRDEFDEIAGWLDEEARRLFPDSRYAQQHQPRSERGRFSVSCAPYSKLRQIGSGAVAGLGSGPTVLTADPSAMIVTA